MKGIQFRSVRSTTIAQALREICKEEDVNCDPDALMLIAERAGGDMRSGINDLQAAAQGQTELKLEDVATAERDVKSSIFKVLEVIFKGNNAHEALQASYNLDESPEDLINWVDENLPLAYRGLDLFWGYDRLARADIFLGRVRRRQVYGLWRYASFLMTGGVQAAKATRSHGYVAFRPPSLWRRMGQTRKARSVRDSAAKKIGRRCHVSAAFARSELMGFVGLLLKDKQKAAPLAAELDLEAEEIALLLGSAPATKKVQTIFEEALKIRTSEEIEDIEMAWHSTAQHSLAGASEACATPARTSAGEADESVASMKTGAGQDSTLSATSEHLMEDPSLPASAVGPGPVEPVASTQGQDGTAVISEGRKGGRPRKAEEEAKAEKTEAKPVARKRQKSLFDF
jgi:replication factor C large subunit